MIARAVKFALFAAVVLCTLIFLLFMTQMGDCPENLIDPSVGNACTTQKHLWSSGLLIVAIAAWVIGAYFIFGRRDRG